MRGRLVVLSLVAGIVVPVVLTLVTGIIGPASSAFAALPQQPKASSGSIGIRLVDVPADSRDNPLSRSYIVGQLTPGTSIRRRVEIINDTGSAALVAVYPAAASLLAGKFAFAPDRSQNELSSWTSVTRAVLRLPAGARALETVTINVPKEASSGEHYAVVWAEVSGPVPAAGGVKLVNRVGVRMYVSIGPGGAPPSNFSIGVLIAERSETGEPLVVARIDNTGERTLDITGELTLFEGPGALRAGPFPVTLGGTLAPDESESATVRLDERLPRGPWRAQMRLSSGFLERVAVATITFPAAKAPMAKAAPAPAEATSLILVVGMLLALLAFAALALLLWRRTRQH